MARETSPTDSQLAEELARRGRAVSPRQIARWRAARLFEYERQFPGRGKGSASSYDPAVVDLVAELDELLTARRSLRDATLILYARGRDLDPAVVRDALVSYLDSVARALERVRDRRRGSIRSLLERSKEGRAMLRHLDQAGLDESVFDDVSAGLLGEETGWVETFLAVTGFTEIAQNFFDNATLIELRRIFGRFTLPELRGLVLRLDATDLSRGVEESAVILPFVFDFVELLARIANTKDVVTLNRGSRIDEDLSTAHWAVMALWAREQGIDLDEGLRLARIFGPGLRAALALARTFSYAQCAVFGPNSQAELERRKSYERESILKKAKAWLTANPQAAAAIRALATADSATTTEPADAAKLGD